MKTMRDYLMISAAGVLLFNVVVGPVQRAAAKEDETVSDFRDYLGYDPSPAYPNGRPNPNAPPELSQFSFFIGEFDCTDRQRNAEGAWREFPAIWNASYFLNGFGIQDKYYAPGFQTSNVRIFDPNKGEWRVSFFSAPGYGSGTWVGQQKGDRIILEQTSAGKDGAATISRLTFFDMSSNGFEWNAENIIGDAPPTKSWTSSCRRRSLSQE